MLFDQVLIASENLNHSSFVVYCGSPAVVNDGVHAYGVVLARLATYYTNVLLLTHWIYTENNKTQCIVEIGLNYN